MTRAASGLLPAIVLAILPAGAATPSGPAALPEIVGVTLMPVAGKSLVGVGLRNPAERELWVSVSLGEAEPVQCGSGRSALPAGLVRWYACPLRPVVPNRAYPVRVEVYADGTSAEPLGLQTSTAKFSRRDVRWLESQL